MRISIGSKVVDGPWGGGNLFVKNLSSYLKSKGNEVIYDLSKPNIDLILLTDPRSRKESSSTFNHIEIQKYKELVNENVIVVQRINECDERKFTNNINKYYLEASHCADHIVFVSSWLRDIYLNLGMRKEKTSVILAGANKAIFNDFNSKINIGNEKVNLVTHHWSAHKNKGFEIYSKIDSLISKSKWSEKLNFTYIGNMNSDYNFLNSQIIEPLAGDELANELKKHHIYITGSINEPSGNHHIEAAQCGLPILYKSSGGIPEYCEGFGLSFDNDLEIKLEEMINNYDTYREKMKQYPFSAENMSEKFYDLFLLLAQKRNLDKKSYSRKFAGRLFIYKNKFLVFFRDYLFFSFRALLHKLFKKVLR